MEVVVQWGIGLVGVSHEHWGDGEVVVACRCGCPGAKGAEEEGALAGGKGGGLRVEG